MFTVSINDDSIRAAFNCFIARMNKDVLLSFDGFLEEVRSVDSISSNANASGVCSYSLSTDIHDSEVANIEIVLSTIDRYSIKTLIGIFAHEFGHLEDRFFNGNSAEVCDEDAELTANTIACYWGFKDELYHMYKEFGYSDESIPINESEIDEECKNGYWGSRDLKVQCRNS